MLAKDVLTPTHLLLILVVVMLVFGAKRLPELGRGLGSAMREFKGGFTGAQPAATIEAPAKTPDAAEQANAKRAS